MTFPERSLILVIVTVIVMNSICAAKQIHRIREASKSETKAWAEVARLRATLTAHGIDFDLIESNEGQLHE